MSLQKILLVCAVAGSLAACGTATKQDDTAGQSDKTATVDAPKVTTPADTTGAGTGAAGLKNTVYFEFDKYDINAGDRDTINGHANLLVKNRGKKVTLEGHCDERGTTEYNMALGEKRANSVKQAMVAQGAGKDQIKTVSYGESRPAVQGHDESAWHLNRRVEIVNP